MPRLSATPTIWVNKRASFKVLKVGNLPRHNLGAFHTDKVIYPVGFKSVTYDVDMYDTLERYVGGFV